MIDRLTLVNFKAFRRLELPLGPLTLLTGLNSSGKSSVLHALALLRQSFENTRSAGSAGGLLLNGDLVELGSARDVLHDDFGPADDLVDADTPVVGLVVEAGRAFRFVGLYDPQEPDEDLMETRVPRALPDFLALPFQYLHADRITPAVTYPRSRQVAIDREFLGVRGEHTVNYLRHYGEREVPDGPLRHPRASSPQLRDQTVAWMQELCPGVNLQAAPIEGTDSVRLSYGFGGTAGINASRRRRPTHVGFGLTYALPIVVACLTAVPGSLILLENPEAHLHPKGQSRMAALIAAGAVCGAQLVVETHSDHVLNGVRLAVKRGVLRPDDTVIHFFRGDGSGADAISPRVDKDGMLAQWPEGFFDEWENSLDQLLD
ncbi:AAA family ATPase [Streptomyces marincola]|uniref:AAA family ATPase n=1 Tax=Streptomyces marincola TaxID=2878388 RepID=UPI001CF49623|nr:DUF3696 domain-containing protein [Streptomyces marincola]UCM90906.1 DUF3696 domain-containing protein [Streptomyces marincola]